MVDVKYTAEFDAAQANRALESLHKNVVSINGAAPKMSQTLKAVSPAARAVQARYLTLVAQ